MTIDMTSHHALECRGSWGGPTTGRTATSPWDQTPGTQTESPRSGGDSDLRVSDAERQATADQLKAHFTAGRLDMDEYDERLQRALSARTGRDLHDLMRDLPSESTAPTQPPRPRPLFVPGAYRYYRIGGADHGIRNCPRVLFPVVDNPDRLLLAVPALAPSLARRLLGTSQVGVRPDARLMPGPLLTLMSRHGQRLRAGRTGPDALRGGPDREGAACRAGQGAGHVGTVRDRHRERSRW